MIKFFVNYVIKSIRILLAIVAYYDCEILQTDVRNIS